MLSPNTLQEQKEIVQAAIDGKLLNVVARRGQQAFTVLNPRTLNFENYVYTIDETPKTPNVTVQAYMVKEGTVVLSIVGSKDHSYIETRPEKFTPVNIIWHKT